MSEQETKQSVPNKSLQLGIPGAIIISAIIIGLAIVFAFGNRNTPNPSTNGEVDITIHDAAKEVGVKKSDLDACLEQENARSTIESHIANAQSIGFRGTPHSVMISHTTDKHVSIAGARSVEQLQAVIDAIDSEAFIVEETDLAHNVLPVTEADHVRGSQNPDITIIEYSDIDCPFCARMHETMIELLQDNDNVQWVYRHTPIASLHPHAYEKALATECVYELSDQNDEKFWEYLDILFLGNK